jgi:hypothetical protein
MRGRWSAGLTIWGPTDRQTTLFVGKRQRARHKGWQNFGARHDVPLLTIGLASEARSTLFPSDSGIRREAEWSFWLRIRMTCNAL